MLLVIALVWASVVSAYLAYDPYRTKEDEVFELNVLALSDGDEGEGGEGDGEGGEGGGYILCDSGLQGLCHKKEFLGSPYLPGTYRCIWTGRPSDECWLF